MTSSIFLPRRSLACPDPRTHLTESTMFVLPEPLGPTMAVTPPSNVISVCRANVLKPSNCRDFRNKTGGESTRCGACLAPGYNSSLFDRFAELTAARGLRLRGRSRRCWERDNFGRLRLRRFAGSAGARLLLGRRLWRHRTDQLFQRGPRG